MGMGRSSRRVFRLCSFTNRSFIHDPVHPESTSISTFCRSKVSSVVITPVIVIWFFPFPRMYRSFLFIFNRYHNASSSFILFNASTVSFVASSFLVWCVHCLRHCTAVSSFCSHILLTIHGPFHVSYLPFFVVIFWSLHLCSVPLISYVTPVSLFFLLNTGEIGS